MYIIERGLVLYRAQIMSAGKVWGDEDIVLTEALLKYERKDRARATTYVEYRQLKRGDLMDVAEGTPVVHKRLRKIAVLVALKRYIIDYAWSEKVKEDHGPGGHLNGTTRPRGLLDRLNDAAELDMMRQREEVVAAERMANIVVAKLPFAQHAQHSGMPFANVFEDALERGRAEQRTGELSVLTASMESMAANQREFAQSVQGVLQGVSTRQDELAKAVEGIAAAVASMQQGASAPPQPST